MKKIAGISAGFLMPVIAFAQGVDALRILQIFKAILDKVIPVLVTAALVYFMYGVVRYVVSPDADDKEKYKKVITHGIIGLFLMLSIWGLVGVIQRTFGIGNTTVTSENIPGVAAF